MCTPNYHIWWFYFKNSLNRWIVLLCTQNRSFLIVFWLFLTKKYLGALNFGYLVIYMTIKSGLFVVQSLFLLISCIFTCLSRNSNRARHLGMCSSLNHRVETVLVTHFSWYSNIREKCNSSVVHTRLTYKMIFLQELLKNSLNYWILLICTQNRSSVPVFWPFLTKKYLEALNFGYFVIYMTIKSDLIVVQS